MNPEDIGRILDEIGERIGPAGEYAWHLTVRQVVIDAVMWGVFGCALLGLAVLTYVLLRRNTAESDKPMSVVDCLALASWAAIPGTAIIALLGTMLLNPEYHAMLRLITTVRP